MKKDEFYKGLSEKITLKMVQVGTDKTNFKILKMLPTSTESITRETGLTKVPVNSRMNQLERVGLAKRRRGTGRIVLTGLGECFMDMIETGEKIIGEQIEEIIKRIV